MTFNPHTATQQELRDWLARVDYLKNADMSMSDMPSAEKVWSDKYCRRADEEEWHPHPPTLDGAAAALPEGMRAERRYCEHMSRWTWAVLEQMPSDVWLYRVSWVPDTGDEITDRYRLACLARVAMKEAGK